MNSINDMGKKKKLPETNNSRSGEYAPDEVNEHGEYIKIGGSPVPGLTLRHILRGQCQINCIAWSPDGKYLASACNDNTIRIWDRNNGKVSRVLKGYGVDIVVWSSDGNQLAAGGGKGIVILFDVQNEFSPNILEISKDETFRDLVWATSGELLFGSIAKSEKRGNKLWVWNFKLKKAKEIDVNHTLQKFSLSPDGNLIAGAGYFHDEKMKRKPSLDLFDAETGEYIQKVKSSLWSNSWDVVWEPNGKFIATGSQNSVIYIWDKQTGRPTFLLEGHTNKDIRSISISNDGKFLASKSEDIRLWRSDTWECVAILNESALKFKNSPIKFNPEFPILATLGEIDTIIRIWELDEAVLLGQAKESVNYTTAKLVLVGDSGVGKTGLGWRLAHGEFKEHASTHGQQFWPISQLNLKRKDGTDCEAVLWDLAGQHVYRQVHSIFLENVAAALVLFDPTNRQEPLKGAQFWLEQLKRNGQLPPAVLVGARVDRGAPTLSQAELDQFCQRYGITGGYISTSAMEGLGLEDLLEIVKAQIPWDDMTATVTTITFKRIKDYVLSLKENTDRKGVLVGPAELRALIEASEISETSEAWEFSDAEMMTAVGHLDTHGYVSVLRNASGEQSILLTPDLLVNLAASIMLLADKNPRELGAISETELLQGQYPFEELKGLELREAQTLLDAAILRFLEHNICFRDTFNDDTLLIFPSLIKQKRPLQDDAPATDDISYVVRGRVENLYASLVVLLGYTPSFSRINQWQNQAQYEMRDGEICGFRMMEEHEGELELVLYYGDKMPLKGREQFHELFEQFLYQRDVEVTRFPPAVCPKGHPIERNTFISRLRDNQKFVFCYACDEKVPLPEFKQDQSIGISASPWLQREAAVARLRSSYEKHLTNIKSYRRSWATPRVYISCLPEQKEWAKKLIRDLHDAGVYVIEQVSQVQPDDFVIVLNSSAYEKAFKSSSIVLKNDVKIIRERLSDGNKKVLSIGCEGQMNTHELGDCESGDFCDDSHYCISLFNLVMNLYTIPLDHKGFEPLRQSLHQQWERTLASLPPLQNTSSSNHKRFQVALSFPGEYRKKIATIAEHLSKALGQERVFYDKYYEAELARPDLDTYIQSIYHDQSELVVVFLCAEYEKKEWCGLEWRAVRDLLKKKETSVIMPMRFDDTQIPGLLSIDGYIDIENRNLGEVAQLILQRLEINRKK